VSRPGLGTAYLQAVDNSTYIVAAVKYVGFYKGNGGKSGTRGKRGDSLICLVFSEIAF
jgi:hypothetical protein